MSNPPKSLSAIAREKAASKVENQSSNLMLALLAGLGLAGLSAAALVGTWMLNHKEEIAIESHHEDDSHVEVRFEQFIDATLGGKPVRWASFRIDNQLAEPLEGNSTKLVLNETTGEVLYGAYVSSNLHSIPTRIGLGDLDTIQPGQTGFVSICLKNNYSAGDQLLLSLEGENYSVATGFVAPVDAPNTIN